MALEIARAKLLGSLTVRRAYQWVRSVPVVGSALHRILLVAVPMGTRRWVRVPRGLGEGLSMFVDPRYELGYVRGDHEPWLSDILKRWLRPGDLFIDVGAHIGYFSLCAARLVAPQGGVIACEPDPDNLSRLRANIRRNDFVRVVQTREAALGGATGEALFRRASAFSSRVGGCLADHVEAGGEYVAVPLLRLDELCMGTTPRAIKVDVEGGEIDVLQGASRIIDEARTGWLIELHNRTAREHVLHRLKNAGYQVQWLQPAHPIYRDYQQEYAIAEPLSFPA